MTEQKIPKTCSTCAHASGDKCMLSGRYQETERKYPAECRNDFTGWVQKLGFKQRVVFWWSGKL